MSMVLLVGEDETLLQTRAAVLRMTGAKILHSRMAAARGILADKECDVVVLCHSLPDEKSVSLAEDVRARWPKTRILRVTTANRFWDMASAGGALDAVSSADPERLVKRTKELLGMPVGALKGDGAGPTLATV